MEDKCLYEDNFITNLCTYITHENDKTKSLKYDYTIIQFDNSPDIIIFIKLLNMIKSNILNKTHKVTSLQNDYILENTSKMMKPHM